VTRRLLHHISAGTVVGLLAAGVMFLLASLMPGLFADFEIATFDLRYRQALAANPLATIEEIVIVDIDSRSLYKMGRFQAWPRTHHAEVIDKLSADEARAVFLDLLLLERDADPQQDLQLAASIRRAGNVYLAVLFSQADTLNFLYPMQEDPIVTSHPEAGWQVAPGAPALRQADRVDVPFAELLAACTGVGAVNWGVRGDNAVRRFPLVHRFLGRNYPAVALRMALDLLASNASPQRPQDGTGIIVDGRIVPTDAAGRLWLNYEGPWKSFRYVSYYDVLQGRLPPGFFADKIVMIGSSAPGLSDLAATPFQQGYPRVEVHATLLHNLLTGRFLERAHSAVRTGCVLGLALICGVVTLLLRPLWALLVLALPAAGLWLGAAEVFAGQRLWIEIVLPAGAGLLAFSMASVYRYWTEEREKQRIRVAFQHYVPPEVAEEVVADPASLRLEGQRKDLTVLFSDIKAFTPMAEKLAPEELARFMNDYLGTMTQFVFNHKGTLDRNQA
jgi:adenylate cyclase